MVHYLWPDSAVSNHTLTSFRSFQLAEDVEDDDSVQVAVKLQAQANVGTLDECFQVYTQEEMVGGYDDDDDDDNHGNDNHNHDDGGGGDDDDDDYDDDYDGGDGDDDD